MRRPDEEEAVKLKYWVRQLEYHEGTLSKNP